jgi:hypothetical protein
MENTQKTVIATGGFRLIADISRSGYRHAQPADVVMFQQERWFAYAI